MNPPAPVSDAVERLDSYDGDGSINVGGGGLAVQKIG
jgi:hypothetical protein